ncbi:murein DD-endopeptidase MepM/ murein hydrolase activator NlpD [Fontibacillus phaseoli]|uniref:Murein DD-endopeptidase MepM/ murein hydrolase activator NlpD n=1 Tax=Fontibacillus phaseoli TaxID=1416533 RepID=A0A369B2D2_9BACL|nr:M23 family metallopeptidase [Fontibacillus phaseoli]RCX15603.1 murein DD-endopeptidase MepM/ murein hydrolase activator NlpD [Fontibacillus phaseoli]
MRGFRGIRWQLWRKGQDPAQMNHGRPENNLEMSEQDTTPAESNTGRRSKPRIIAASAIAALLVAGGIYLAGQQYVEANTVSYYRVYVAGKEIGTIADEEQLQALFEQKEQEYNEKYPQVEMAVHTEGITTVPDKAYKAEIQSEKTLETLDGMLTGYAKGVELKVDGKTIGIVKDRATADAVLEKIKGKYASEDKAVMATTRLASKVKKTGGARQAAATGSSGTGGVILESVGIEEDVSTASVETDPNKVMDVNKAVARILAGDEARVTYAVREGDTISSIAARFGVTQKELFGNNPGIKELTLQIGTELKINTVKPSLTVKTVEKFSEQIEIEPQVIVRKSEDLKAGQTKVISLGASGLKTMNYRLTKENGEVIAEEWLGQEVITESKPKIVVRGTKVVGEGSGEFAWPVSGATLSSSYGERWGRTHKGIDLVSSDRSILAADEGVVTFTGTKSGYGNCIIIDHKNGYETLYGHLSKISVEEGQVVQKGSEIGIMGNTGRSTGTHLHFEIHKDGSIQNPMKYL